MEERTMGDVVLDLRDECEKMLALCTDAEWGLASWHTVLWNRGKRLASLLAELGIEPDGQEG